LLATDDAARRAVIEECALTLNAPSLLRDGPAFTALCDAARGMGCWSLVEPENNSLVTETTGPLEAYRAGLSSKVRSEIVRLRKAEREHRARPPALSERRPTQCGSWRRARCSRQSSGAALPGRATFWPLRGARSCRPRPRRRFGC
jgi:hypothetical protein